MLTYKQQLLDPRWQKRRLKLLEAADWQCQNCQSTERTLHVHHRQYFRGKMPWEYLDEQMAVLCDRCHDRQHVCLDTVKHLLSISDVEPVLPIIGGFLHSADWVADQDKQAIMSFDMQAYAAGYLAWVAGRLPSSKIHAVATFASSLLNEDDEERMCFDLSAGQPFWRDS